MIFTIVLSFIFIQICHSNHIKYENDKDLEQITIEWDHCIGYNIIDFVAPTEIVPLLEDTTYYEFFDNSKFYGFSIISEPNDRYLYEEYDIIKTDIKKDKSYNYTINIKKTTELGLFSEKYYFLFDSRFHGEYEDFIYNIGYLQDAENDTQKLYTRSCPVSIYTPDFINTFITAKNKVPEDFGELYIKVNDRYDLTFNELNGIRLNFQDGKEFRTIYISNTTLCSLTYIRNAHPYYSLEIYNNSNINLSINKLYKFSSTKNIGFTFRPFFTDYVEYCNSDNKECDQFYYFLTNKEKDYYFSNIDQKYTSSKINIEFSNDLLVFVNTKYPICFEDVETKPTTKTSTTPDDSINLIYNYCIAFIILVLIT